MDVGVIQKTLAVSESYASKLKTYKSDSSSIRLCASRSNSVLLWAFGECKETDQLHLQNLSKRQTL